MKKIEIGKKVKNFTAESTNKEKFNLKDNLKGFLILFFYPKDNTPGCTQEGLDFSENYRKFLNQNALVFGVSKDNLKSHHNFKKNLNLNLI